MFMMADIASVLDSGGAAIRDGIFDTPVGLA